MLHEAPIDDAAARRIVKSPCSFVLQEESLIDPLVYHNKSDLGSRSILWVKLANRLLELGHFNPDNSITLCITYPITEDDVVGRH